MWRRGSEDPGADIPVAVWMVVPMGRFRARRRTTWEVVSVVFCSKVSNDLSAEERRVSSMLSLAKVVFVVSWNPANYCVAMVSMEVFRDSIDCAISCCSFVSLRLGANTRNHQRMERKKNPIERLLKKSNRKAVTNCNEISSLFRLIR